MNNLKVEKELHKEDGIEILKQEEIKRLLKALDTMKGHSVVIESIEGILIYRPCDDFDYNLKLNSKDKVLLDFDNIEKEFIVGIAIKLDDIWNVEIDDNLEWLESGQMTEYECESIIITLWNKSALRISIEW